MIEIDGSYLEGGGQILRTAVALSAITGEPFFIRNIRANRIEPGIRPSHLASIEAVGKLCGADFDVKVGDTEMEFKPGKLKSGHLTINTGTAGSIPLILQAVMIPAAHTEVEIDIKGGTITKWAPTIHYIENVTLPLLKRMGYRGSLDVVKHGFYPKGGGEVVFSSEKAKLKKIEWTDPGEITSVEGLGTVTNDLKRNDVGERLKKFARQKLFKKFRVVPRVGYEYVDALSTGSSVDIFVKTKSSVWGASSLGETRKRIEYVVDEAVDSLAKDVKHRKFLDQYMADQILPYMALAGNSKVTVSKITDHTKTNAFIIEKFLPVKFTLDESHKTIKVA